MRALHGAGIAAPQIGVGARVVIFELKENPRYPHIAPVPYTVLVNPVLDALGDGAGRGLGGVPVGAGHARAGAALPAPALPGVRCAGGAALTARSRASTRAWCSTRSTTWMAYSSRNACADLRNFGFEDALAAQLTPMPD